jgi:predicted transcriptional regulator
MSRKESILDVIHRLPEDVAFDEAVEEIRILQRIEEGERASDEGRVRPHEQVRELIRSWISG